mgnify:CR=1 FL=1|jgi:hypothetical protein
MARGRGLPTAPMGFATAQQEGREAGSYCLQVEMLSSLAIKPKVLTCFDTFCIIGERSSNSSPCWALTRSRMTCHPTECQISHPAQARARGILGSMLQKWVLNNTVDNQDHPHPLPHVAGTAAHLDFSVKHGLSLLLDEVLTQLQVLDIDPLLFPRPLRCHASPFEEARSPPDTRSRPRAPRSSLRLSRPSLARSVNSLFSCGIQARLESRP